jgi:alcohol dehydrogenase (cytochrome c)
VVDHWDHDHPFERMLVETAVSPDPKEVAWINPRLKPGERRKVVTGIPGKTGLVYTLDRATGEFLWARSTVMQNVIKGIDGATGVVTVNRVTFSKLGETKLTCPSAQGGRTGRPAPTTRA